MFRLTFSILVNYIMKSLCSQDKVIFHNRLGQVVKFFIGHFCLKFYTFIQSINYRLIFDQNNDLIFCTVSLFTSMFYCDNLPHIVIQQRSVKRTVSFSSILTSYRVTAVPRIWWVFSYQAPYLLAEFVSTVQTSKPHSCKSCSYCLYISGSPWNMLNTAGKELLGALCSLHQILSTVRASTVSAAGSAPTDHMACHLMPMLRQQCTFLWREVKSGRWAYCIKLDHSAMGTYWQIGCNLCPYSWRL